MHHSTIILALQKWASAQPDKIALRYLFAGDIDGPTTELTYSLLFAKVSAIAAVLTEHCQPGDRALLLYPPDPAFACGFLGCLQAGVIAVPAYHPNPANLARELPRLLGIIEDCNASLILTSASVRDRVATTVAQQPGLETLPVIATDDLPDAPRACDVQAAERGEIAFLQYTSGSTSQSKGVMVTHASLDHNTRVIAQIGEHDSDTVLVSWAPVYHDMGLIGGLLQPLYLGGTTVQMPPTAFLAKPARWLAAVSHYRGTSSPFPNFALELCVRKAHPEDIPGLELSSWRVAWNGAEPVRVESMRRFAARFEPYGFASTALFPVYGLAETTLVASAPRLGTGYRCLQLNRNALEDGRVALATPAHPTVEIVSCGGPIPDEEIRIVDPDSGRELSNAASIGEIWLRSPSIGKGYWRKPTETTAAFKATLPSAKGHFLRTGDLGFLYEGELFVTGRLKDLIIVNGRNVSPHDLERTAEAAHAAVRPGCTAAFPLESEGREVVGLVAEINPKKIGDEGVEHLARCILDRIGHDHELALHVLVLIEPRSIPKTSSGKLQRRATRLALERDELSEVHRWTASYGPVSAPVSHESMPRVGEVEAWLLKWLAADVDARESSLAADQPFVACGLDSVRAVEMAAALSEHLGIEVSATAVWDYPTPRRLAQYLTEKEETVSKSTMANDNDGPTATVSAGREPIAIIGMGCRFPGGVVEPESFWRLLAEGVDAVTEVPSSRWDASSFFTTNPDEPGKMVSRWGGFIDGADRFDRDLFNISPGEARGIDPQQRLLLEVAHEAVEDAGFTRELLRGSNTGVFAAVGPSEYGWMNLTCRPLIDCYTATGAFSAIAANRISYFFDLQGPSFSVDAVCSSSLVALHLAIQSLRNHECTTALVGASTLLLTADGNIAFSKLGVLSPNGRCRAFSEDANGIVLGEGVACIVLKPLSAAVANGDRVYATILGSAITQDGKSNGLTAPSARAQERMLHQACRDAAILPSTVQYVEAHGTGTPIGDPIEAKAIAAVYGQTRTEANPLLLGSVKSNIGHLAAVGGLAGLIKTVLSLCHGRVPPSLHCKAINPLIPMEAKWMEVPSSLVPWPKTDESRRAGVTSLSFGGTNVHVLLEEAKETRPSAYGTEVLPCPLLLSGLDEGALREQARRWAAWLLEHPETDWAGVLRTAASHRTHFDARAAIQAEGIIDACEALTALADDRSHQAVSVGHARERGKVVFVFPGQGSQWPEMGRVLLDESTTFNEAVVACDVALRPHTGWSVSSVLRGDADDEIPPLERVDVVQPALFTMGVALAAVWRSLGLEPAAVVGHSQGEITAAVVAGALSLEDGAKIVALRSQLVRRLAGPGGMAVTELSVDEVEKRLHPDWLGLSVAVVNTPTSTAISGDNEDIDAWVTALTGEGVFCRRVDVDYASHSAHMDPVVEELSDALFGLSARSCQVPMVSTVTGEVIDGCELDAQYWCQNLREPVRLDRALDTLQGSGHGVFVEVSPHPVLAMPLTTACADNGGLVIGSLTREIGGLGSLYRNLGVLHVQGHPIDWAALFVDTAGELVPLPTYAFQRQRYWLEAKRYGVNVTEAGLSSVEHPFLGAMTRLANSEGLLLTGRLSLSEHEWLADHRVFGAVLMPGTGLLELAFSAARALGCTTISELMLAAPLVLPERGSVRVQVQVEAPDAEGCRGIAISSRIEDASEEIPWTQHATGKLASREAEPHGDSLVEAWPPSGTKSVDISELYSALSAQELSHEPSFQGIIEAYKDDQCIYGRVALPDTLVETAGEYGIHPALLDAALHVLAIAGINAANSEGVLLPFTWSDVTLHATGATELRVRLQLSSSGNDDEATATLVVTDTMGLPIATVGALRLRRATPMQILTAAQSKSRDLYRVDWQPVALAEVPGPITGWVLGGEGLLADVLSFDRIADVSALVAKLDAGAQAPEYLIIDVTVSQTDSDALVEATHTETERALTELQGLLDEERLLSTVLIWVTSSAIGTGADDAVQDLTHTPLWGLIRSARNEHPERQLRLVDIDTDSMSSESLGSLLFADTESELALRDGFPLAARLMQATKSEKNSTGVRAFAAEGTVLITDGLSDQGQVVARHLVRQYGVRHLVLTSHGGNDASGAEKLAAGLESLGAKTVTVTTCDVANRKDLATVINSISDNHSLAGVFHLAEMLDDGLVTALTPERLQRVLRPKIDGAWNLHELTHHRDLSAFVLFSSVAGVMGSPGQSNYAAGNTFLDALAVYRHKRGLPAQSLAWGFWDQQGADMTSHPSMTELARLKRRGLVPVSVETGLALFDAALRCQEHGLVLARLDVTQMQHDLGDAAQIPSLLRSLLRQGPRRVQAAVKALNLRQRLTAVPENERLGVLVNLVQEEVAMVLGLPGVQAVPSARPIKDLGLDSLMAVELRNQLSARVETTLPATLAFDYPTPDGIAGLLLREAFAELKTETSETSASQCAHDEPIAIVAMACRTPGGVSDPESYWALLDAGGDAVGSFPDRWDVERLYDPNPESIGKTYAREGGFLKDIDHFDAGFFGVSPREALSMDPQQRLVLEVAWEALERAGICPDALNESATGVYIGSIGSDYGPSASFLETFDGYWSTGQASSVLSGRLSYVLGLQGPAVTVDTACSSSLVAVHFACAGLRQGECDLALAGGVQVMSTPAMFVETSRQRLLARDGRCKAFSASADGAGWSEGCGVLVLKRFSDAERDGDQVLAVVRGSAVNHDGRSQGFTAPNGPSQQRVIRRSLSVCGLSPDDIDAVEAHGTGTELGDPIEAGALAEVFGPTRSDERPLWLGSSKSNIGHTQAAAGVLGVMKMVLSLQHESLPKTLHAETPSEHIAWDGSGLTLLQEARPWPRQPEHIRRAGVSGFGISGTNAHIILEEASVVDHRAQVEGGVLDAGLTPLPLLVSGHDESALREQARRWATWLSENPETDWADLLRTAALHRTHFDTRAAIQAENTADACEALGALAERRSHVEVSLGQTQGRQGTSRLVVLLTGQGSQRVGMGRGLYGRSGFESFTETFDAAITACEPHLDRPLTEVMWAEKPDDAGSVALHQTRYTQPALFALETALFRQWLSWGVKPDVLLGHSIGELVAAHLAGVLSLEDAATLVCARGRLMDELAMAGGAMASLQASEEAVRAAIEQLPEPRQGGVDIAGLNTPTQTVISGDIEAVEALVAAFEKMGCRSTRLTVSHAFHSTHMDGMLEAFAQVAGELAYNQPSLPVISNVTGKLANTEDGDLVTAAYWVRHVRQAVRFLDGVQMAVKEGAGAFLECGPDGVLCGMVAECIVEQPDVAGRMGLLPSLRKKHDDRRAVSVALGNLHVRGHHINWATILHGIGSGYVNLPTYAFQQQRYWLEPTRSMNGAKDLGLSPIGHPLLRAMTRIANSKDFLLTGQLSLSEHEWLAQHKVFGAILIPRTGFLEFAFAAAWALDSTTVSELTVIESLIIPEQGSVRVQVQVEAPNDQGHRGFAIYSRIEESSDETPWTQHATGVLALSKTAEPHSDALLQSWPPPRTMAVDLAELYPELAAQGFSYGPAFQGLTEAYKDDKFTYGRVVLPESLVETAGDYGIHPALLDAALQVLFVAGIDATGSEEVLLPFAWSNATLHATGATELRVRLQLSCSESDEEKTAALVITDAMGLPVATVEALRLRRATAEQICTPTESGNHNLYRVDWQPVSFTDTPEPASTWVLGETDRLAEALGFERAAEASALIAKLEAGAHAPERLIIDVTAPQTHNGDLVGTTHKATERALADLQALLGEKRLASTVLVWLTRSAIGTEADGTVQDLIHTPLWGLVRSARSEHPDRLLRLVDIDTDWVLPESLGVLLSADTESELVLRNGTPAAARLVLVGNSSENHTETRPLAREGTVLVSGGTGELGRVLARHLVCIHGVRHVVLASRRGDEAPGAEALVAELKTLGAETVTVVACDVANRQELATITSSIPGTRPLTGVFHLASIRDDGLVTALTPGRLGRVLRPKVDGAWNLHELTLGQDLSVFVLFSSIVGVMGGAGQSNCAAGNTFLDALAAHRRKQGLVGQSLAWGFWEQQGVGMTSHLGTAELARMRRQGLMPMSIEMGLGLFDAALRCPEAGLVPVRIDVAQMQRQFGESGEAPALLRSLVRPGLRLARAGTKATGLRRQLASVAEGERHGVLVKLVQEAVAAVLGLAGPQAVPRDRPIKDLGLDSLMAVELRNRITSMTGVNLPPTAVFRFPEPMNLAEAISGELAVAADDAEALAEQHQEGAVRATASDVSVEVAAPPVEAIVDGHRLPQVTPTSPGQRRLWFLHKVLENPATYNVSVAFRVQAAFSPDLVRQAIEHLIARHNQLRVCFVERDGTPFQRVLPWVEPDIEVHDLSDFSSRERDEALVQLRAETESAAFDLSSPPLFRIRMVRTGLTETVLLSTFHHATTDGTSASVFFRELFEAYEAAAVGQSPRWQPVASYVSYNNAFSDWLKGPEAQESRLWWRNELAGCPVLELPTDHPMPRTRSHRGNVVNFSLSSKLSDGVDALARSAECTPFVVLLGVWAALLHRYSSQRDFAVGTVVTGRDIPGYEGTIGFFVNTLPIRCQFDSSATFYEHLQQLRDSFWSILDRQRLPLEEVIRASGASRVGDVSSNPLFRTVFVLEESKWFEGFFEGAPVESLHGSVGGDVPGTAKFDLSLVMARKPGGYSASLEFSTDLFETPTVGRMVGHFETLLGAAVEVPDTRVSELPLLPESERQKLLVEFNDTAVDYKGPQTLPGLFEAQVEKTPQNTAVVFEDRSVTYEALNAHANQLAHYLRGLGVGSDVRVGVCLERCLELPMVLLGILKAGGAYVPLDPSYPVERLRFMAEDSELMALVTMSDIANPGWPEGLSVIELDEASVMEAIGGQPNTNPSDDGTTDPQLHPDNLAYVIYTSGSTGQPKGVMVSHRNATNVLLSLQSVVGRDESTRLLAVTTVCFDISVLEIFDPLVVGGNVIVPQDAVVQSPTLLRDLLVGLRPTVMQATPSTWRMLREVGFPDDLHPRVLCGGEPYDVDLARALARWACHAYNVYGPTEATVWATYDTFTDSDEQIFLGQPINNTQVYILSQELEVCPAGVAGELFIGGLQVARGYLKRPGLTAERFVPDPFGPAGSRLYRTGDLCRWRSDGNLEFLGRLDDQVKIRGFRIELGEIESCLSKHPSVNQCVVVARENNSGVKRLVAYVVAADKSEAPSLTKLRNHVTSTLPEYMVPSAFIVLDGLPLTPNGKVDRKALPAPEHGRSQTGEKYVAPRTTTEERLVDVWSEVLGLGTSTIGVHDNFFALGGDSILAIQVVSRAAERGLTLSLRDLFEFQTIGELEALLGDAAGTSAALELDLKREVQSLEMQLPDPILPCGATSPPREVLLTGATGFVGAHLLVELAVRHGLVVHCLVRAGATSDASRRLRGVLECYDIDVERLPWDRIHVHTGDMSMPHFGLSDGESHALEGCIDAVVHCGAQVDHARRYADLKATNVLGTIEAIRFALRGKPKMFHFVSTTGVRGVSETESQAPHLPEYWDIPTPRGTVNGYAQSKWVAEQLVHRAAKRGLSAVVYRPGLVWGHSRTGAIPMENYWLTFFLKACVEVRAVPDVVVHLSGVSVNQFCRAVVTRLTQPEDASSVFNLDFPIDLDAGDVASLYKKVDVDTDVVPYSEWHASLRQVAETTNDPDIVKLAALASDRNDPFGPVSSTSETTAGRRLIGEAATARVSAFETFERTLLFLRQREYVNVRPTAPHSRQADESVAEDAAPREGTDDK